MKEQYVKVPVEWFDGLEKQVRLMQKAIKSNNPYLIGWASGDLIGYYSSAKTIIKNFKQ